MAFDMAENGPQIMSLMMGFNLVLVHELFLHRILLQFQAYLSLHNNPFVLYQ